MASPFSDPASTGVVALDSARRTLSIIIEDQATDIPYSADALDRLTKLLPRNIRTFDNMNQASQVAEHFLLQSPKWKSDYQNQNKDYIDDEASALYHSIVEGLSRLRDKEEIYLVIFEQKGRVLVNHKRRGNRLMAVEKGIERLLKIMMEKECFGNAEDGGEGAPGEDRKVKIESSGEGEDVGAAGSYKYLGEPDVFFKLEDFKPACLG